MSRRYILYITSDGLRWYRLQSGRAELLENFEAGEEGQRAFTARLAPGARNTSFAVLIDLADEAFHIDTVPAVSGGDRKAMLARKLTQHFYGNAYTATTSLGREKAGRKDEKILFAAITRQATIEPWVDALIKAEARVSGIHSVPLLLDRMLERKRSGLARCLLVSLTPAGLRQSFFDEGRLRFSRLTAHHDGSANLVERIGSDEIRKTHAYLTGQRMLARGEPIDVLVMASPQEFEALVRHDEGGDELRLVLATCDSIASRLKLPLPPPGSSDCLPLMLAALDREPTCLHLGGQAVRRFHRIHLAQRALIGAAAVVLVAGLLFAGKQWFEAAEIRDRAETQRLEAADRDARYRQLIGSLPPLPAPLDQLRRLIDDIDRLESLSIPALRILLPLSRALENEPELKLVRLRWQLDERGNGTSNGAGEWLADAQVVTLAELQMPDYLEGDQRRMVELSERFTRELARYAGDSVRIVRLPIDLQSTQTLRGREGGEQQAARAAPLEVQYAMPGPRRN